jgi:putative hydrolase of the HAD superfamily
MIQAVLFDLDDTLYPESDYFAGALGEIARVLEARGVGEREELQTYLLSLHRQDRDRVFDRAARQRRFPSAWVGELVARCRAHRPSLRLPEQSRRLLMHLRKQYRIGCVTDGWAAVQRGKIAALGLEPLVDALVVTDELGRPFWKPHPRPLLVCCAMLHTSPREAVFVGDHPDRDMLAARRAGLRCVRLRRPDGYFANHESRWTADATIGDLAMLEEALARLDTRRMSA